MTEDELSKLSIDALLDRLMQSTKELINLVHKKDLSDYEAKKIEVQQLQKIIVARRAEI